MSSSVLHYWRSWNYRIVCLLVITYLGLTTADLATTLFALAAGGTVELNPSVAGDRGGFRTSFFVMANGVLLAPLVVAFAVGLARADEVPVAMLARWPRYIFDVFYVNPLDDEARLRRPWRLVTAALTLVVLKTVIVASNLLVIAGWPNPTSLLAALWTSAGVGGTARYWASYAVIITPCYAISVGLAAQVLRLAQTQRLHVVGIGKERV